MGTGGCNHILRVWPKSRTPLTMVTWSMFGQKNFISKAVCLFMDMDKMLGGEMEKGLASVKLRS